MFAGRLRNVGVESAKKAVDAAHSRSDLVEILSEFTRFKNIDRTALMGVLEDVFRTMLRKKVVFFVFYNVLAFTDRARWNIRHANTQLWGLVDIFCGRFYTIGFSLDLSV